MQVTLKNEYLPVRTSFHAYVITNSNITMTTSVQFMLQCFKHYPKMRSIALI